MNWIPLITESQLHEISQNSAQRPQVIYKHSTRCSISSIVKSRIDRNVAPEGVDFYYLDIIAHRPISNKLAQDYEIRHESPQVLVIQDGKCIYDESHTSIHMDDIETSYSVK